MTIQEWLQQCTNILTEADIPTARLDCLVLLEDVTGLGRAHLLAHPTDPLTQPQLDWLEELVLQRAKHTPSPTSEVKPSSTAANLP